MKRVLHVRSGRSVAGPERQILELARELPAAGFELEVVVLERGATAGVLHPFLRELSRAGVPASACDDPDRGGHAAADALARRLARGDVDLLHSHDPKANWVALRAAAGRVPQVATLHLHTRTTPALRLHARFDRWLARRIDALIEVAPGLAVRLRDRRGRVARTIANGFGGEGADRPSRDPTAARSALVVGRLTRQKGIDLLLAALPTVLARHPGFRVAVAGDGPERAALAATTRERGVADAVDWLGRREDVPELLATASLLVLPSRTEGSPYAVLEAMAAGVPVVASATGGVPELLDHGRAGFLARPGDAADLARALLEALDRPEESLRRATAAAVRRRERHSARGMAERTAAVYRELAA